MLFRSTDAACEAELARVLARGFAKRALDAREQEAAMVQFRRFSKRVETNLSDAERSRLPKCKDADDQKFLEVALGAGADLLVTKDRELLRLASRRGLPFRILTPAEAAKAL